MLAPSLRSPPVSLMFPLSPPHTTASHADLPPPPSSSLRRTFPPALQLILQLLDHDLQTPGLVLLLLVLLLPLLGGELQVHRHSVLDGLCPEREEFLRG